MTPLIHHEINPNTWYYLQSLFSNCPNKIEISLYFINFQLIFRPDGVNFEIWTSFCSCFSPAESISRKFDNATVPGMRQLPHQQWSIAEIVFHTRKIVVSTYLIFITLLFINTSSCPITMFIRSVELNWMKCNDVVWTNRTPDRQTRQ